MMKIRHQLFLKGKESNKLLVEQFVEYDMTLDELEKPIKQIGIMNWEEENLVNANVFVKRQVLDDEEWEKEIKKFKNSFSLEYLQSNKKFLSIRAIEQNLEMPDSTLIKAVNGSQNLPKKYEERLSKFLMGLQNPKSVGENLK